MKLTPQSEIESPVDIFELAEWLGGMDDPDPVLYGIALSATDIVINYLNRDIYSRDWVLVIPEKRGSAKTLSRLTSQEEWIELPYTGLIEVKAVSVDSTAYEYETEDGNPAKVKVTGYTEGEITITYTAGFVTIPQVIKDAVKMVSVYLYENRGADSSDAVKKSGAANLLKRYRVEYA